MLPSIASSLLLINALVTGVKGTPQTPLQEREPPLREILSASSPLEARAQVDQPLAPQSVSHSYYPTSASSGSGCRGEPIASGWHNVTLTVSGSQGPYNRTHLVRIPPAYDGVQPLPILFGFHGSQGDPTSFINPSDGTGSHLDITADEESFVLVLPTGSVRFYDQTTYNQTGEKVPAGYGWHVPYVPSITSNTYDDPVQDDIAYVLEILQSSKSSLCIDERRAYATGHSGGGRMTSALACDPEASNHFAAFAPVSGIRAGPADTSANLSVPVKSGYQACRPSRSAGIVTSHGGADSTNPYNGNSNPQWGYSVDTAVATWRALLGCSYQSVIEVPLNGTEPSVIRKATSWCGQGGVTLFFVTDHEHPWPSDVAGWNSSRVLWSEVSSVYTAQC